MNATKTSGISAGAKKVLEALIGVDAPMNNKQLQNASGLESKQVSAAIKELKTQGLVESPARCKYGITGAGKKSL